MWQTAVFAAKKKSGQSFSVRSLLLLNAVGCEFIPAVAVGDFHIFAPLADKLLYPRFVVIGDDRINILLDICHIHGDTLNDKVAVKLVYDKIFCDLVLLECVGLFDYLLGEIGIIGAMDLEIEKLTKEEMPRLPLPLQPAALFSDFRHQGLYKPCSLPAPCYQGSLNRRSF